MTLESPERAARVLRARSLAIELGAELNAWRTDGSPRSLIGAVSLLGRLEWMPTVALADADALATLSVARTLLDELAEPVEKALSGHLDLAGILDRALQIRMGHGEEADDWVHDVLMVAACLPRMDTRCREDALDALQHAVAVAEGAPPAFRAAVSLVAHRFDLEGSRAGAPVEVLVIDDAFRELGQPTPTADQGQALQVLRAAVDRMHPALLEAATEYVRDAKEWAELVPRATGGRATDRPQALMADSDDDEIVLRSVGRGRLLLGLRSGRVWWEGLGTASLSDGQGRTFDPTDGGWQMDDLPDYFEVQVGANRAQIRLPPLGRKSRS